MTQDEKFAARVKKDDGFYNIKVLVVDGKIVFWLAPELLGKPEGFSELPKSEISHLTPA